MAQSPPRSLRSTIAEGRIASNEGSVSSRALSAIVGDADDDDSDPSGSTRKLNGDDVVMTNREVAAYLKTTVEQMCRLRRSGRGPRFAQVGALIRYKKSVVDAWLAGQTMTPAD